MAFGLTSGRDDGVWMRRALAWARAGAAAGEVPVGAVVVAGDRLVAGAHNLCETLPDATAHAERLAIGAAARALGRWRLGDCTLFVSLEPCMMCAGAVQQARLGRVVFGAFIRSLPDGGAAGGWLSGRRPDEGAVAAVGGVMAADSEALLAAFFAARRPPGGA